MQFSLLDFKSPEKEKNNAVLLISGKEQILGLGEIYELKGEENNKEKQLIISYAQRYIFQYPLFRPGIFKINVLKFNSLDLVT